VGMRGGGELRAFPFWC